jgi:hypothetical protein
LASDCKFLVESHQSFFAFPSADHDHAPQGREEYGEANGLQVKPCR